jgi:3-isopropylmalate/(R)-2-methylmalate dehydratase small subunit
MIIKGKVHKLGDNINTDDIIAAQYLDSQDAGFLGSKCMENIDPEFSRRLSKGDIIVAGKNFGCGSSREHAPLAIKGAGVSLVIAESFARIFYRNSINIGLVILESKQAGRINPGDRLKVDLDKGEIIVNEEEVFHSQKFPPFLQSIVKAGGLINWVKILNKKKQ